MLPTPALNLVDPARRSLTLAAAAGGLLAASGARAQALPFENTRIVVGFPPGGTSDTTSRRMGERLRGTWGRNVVVDNKAGAGGRIAVETLKTLPADGSSMLLTPASILMIYPHIYPKLSYNVFEDVVPVSMGCAFHHGLAVGPAVPESVRNVRELIAFFKANPDKANYGSPAAGSVPHFLGALLEKAAGFEIKHVAFRGSQAAVLDMMGGQVASVSAPVGEFLPHLKTGKLRILATSGTTRDKFAPAVPTYTEQGFGTISAREWFGFFMPKGSPDAVVQAVSSQIRAAAAHPDYVAGLEVMGLEAVGTTSAELGRILKADHDRWAPIVKQIGFTAES
jgi:tripartite-type tricarboxylate transporter receptor subunit TctC